jgi:predicted nucleic acid-binding protein
MILVADCSALIALSACGQLELLEKLFETVVVPDAVYLEATVADKKEARQLKTFLQGKVRQVDISQYVFLDAFADLGETEAMLLYKQLAANKLLIDDKRGRKVAKINNISIIGSLGVLLAAKERGLITEIAPLLNLIQQSDVHISDTLIESVLELAGERLPIKNLKA